MIPLALSHWLRPRAVPQPQAQPQPAPALAEQLREECEAMARYALHHGLPVAPELIAQLGALIDGQMPAHAAPHHALAAIHRKLAAAIAPATPQAVTLLDLVNRFVTNSQYAIDPNQVYVAGLSSGGGMTMVLGCIAPDIFAGIGINAGPPPGTTTSQIGVVPSGYTATTAANNCKAWAGSNASSFNTQIAGAVWGTSDYTVAQAYGPMDTAAFRQIYGGTFTQGAQVSISGGGTNTPYTDSNGKLRTHEISVSGMAHAWPAGTGGDNTNYVDATHINYPAFVMDYWVKNNLRAGSGPVQSGGTPTGLTVTGTTTTSVSLSWNAVTNATSYNVYRNGSKVGSSTSTTYTDTGLIAGTTYSYTVTEIDPTAGESAQSSAVSAKTQSSFACTATTASNYAHVQAGRAHDSGGIAYANGSNQSMGLDNVFYTNTLAQTAAGYYVIGNCP